MRVFVFCFEGVIVKTTHFTFCCLGPIVGDFTDHPFQLFLPITMLTVDRGPRAPSFPIDESTSDIRSDEPQIFGETDLSENDDFPDASSSDEGGLRADDIQQVQEALVTVNNLTRPSTDPKLGPVPERIQDKYSAVQGDAFHVRGMH